MPIYHDDLLGEAAPNISVQVGSPPQPSSSELPRPEGPTNIFTILDIDSRKTQPIGKDRTNDLIEKTKPKPPTKFLIKNYGDLSAVTLHASPPPPPSRGSLSPGTQASGSSSTKTYILELPPDLPFDADTIPIEYVPKELVGVFPLSNGEVSKFSAWDPLMKSMLDSFKGFPSAIFIDAIHSCISTPYFAPAADRHVNGVSGSSKNPPGATYLWEMHTRGDEDQSKILEPREDGAINVEPQPCSAKKPRGHIYLDPGKWEKVARIEGNGHSLNAFSLIFGITPGGDNNMHQAGSYHIKIIFGNGDVKLTIFEGQEEARVSMMGKDPEEKVTIKPSVGDKLLPDFGNKVYIVTFIPVWNGLLVSFGNPGSSDWGDSVRFIPIDENLDINKAITDVVVPPPQSDDDVPDPNYIPKTVVVRNGKRYKTPGVRIINSRTGSESLSRSNTGPGQPSTFKMGTRLNIEFFHCGGALKFVPLYFPQYSRYHFVYPGTAMREDPNAEPEYVPVSPPPSKKKPKLKLKPIEQNVFLVETKFEGTTMPIFGFHSGHFVDFRTHVCTIVKDKQAPFACFSMEFKSVNPDVRVPIQVWGGMFVDNIDVSSGFITQAPANQDGVLWADSISVPRIRSISVQRSLDGASGDIEWDRFDPLTQQVDPRPYQRVGAIQIQATGGANTVPGTIFTGIAYGNAEVDNLGENLIRVPLKGRESKLNSEGGLMLLNVPFFDGYEHTDVMNYMALYGGFPLRFRNEKGELLTQPFKLPSSYNINSPVVFFSMGTPVAQAMDQICQYVGTVYYFDRFGTCVYIDQNRSTGRDWYYPDLAVENFSDETDHTWVRNQIAVTGLVAYPQAEKSFTSGLNIVPTQAIIMFVNLKTYPEFAWKKGALYAFPVIFRDMNELKRIAIQIAQGQSRPRSQARCKIPGNAQIELLDSINGKWLVTSISHQIDLQRKTWSTDIGIELFVPDVMPIASIDMPPIVAM
jgi:hypothetical protein